MKPKTLVRLSLLALSAFLLLNAAEIVEEIVAIINDDVITLSQYKAQHEALYQMLKAQLSQEDFDKQYPKLREGLLDSMITELLLLQLAREKQLNVGEELKRYIENIKKEANIESDEDLRREVRKQGVDFEQWMKQNEENILRQVVIATEVDRTIVIDESEIVNYYKQYPQEFIEPEEVKLRGIHLSPEERGEEVLESLKKEINDKIKAGEDLAALAGQFSDGPLKDNQGDLGTFKKGELDKTLEQTVEKVKKGEITPWVKAKNGWYLLRVEDRKESRLKSFEEVKKDVEEKIFNEKRSKKISEFLKNLRESSYVKILKPNPLNF